MQTTYALILCGGDAYIYPIKSKVFALMNSSHSSTHAELFIRLPIAITLSYTNPCSNWPHAIIMLAIVGITFNMNVNICWPYNYFSCESIWQVVNQSDESGKQRHTSCLINSRLMSMNAPSLTNVCHPKAPKQAY